jgi:S1-C subfamily serine protease
MNFTNYVIQIKVKSKNINFSNPKNIYGIINSSGTGFFITNKLILTCHHVIKDSINIEILYKQKNINAKVKYIFPDDDIAIIEINENIDNNIFDLKVINGIDNNLANNKAYTVGFPLNSTTIKISEGIISGFQDSLIQTDATLNSGNSGGPLLIKENDIYKVIGINVSKLIGKAEGTGYGIPIYRFLIYWDKIKNMNDKNIIIIRKPLFHFDYQKLLQKKLLTYLFNDNNMTGIRVSSINNNNYLSKYIKPDDILTKINNNKIDNNGLVLFDFYPEKIKIRDLGLWFKNGDIINIEIFNPNTKQLRNETIKLKKVETNLDYYNIKYYPNYYIEKNNMIFSIFSTEHINNLNKLKLSAENIIQLLERTLYNRDLFTIYLADINYDNITNGYNNNKFVDFPIGKIITEINGKTFNNYDEFIKIIKDDIKYFTTIDNNIYFI